MDGFFIPPPGGARVSPSQMALMSDFFLSRAFKILRLMTPDVFKVQWRPRWFDMSAVIQFDYKVMRLGTAMRQKQHWYKHRTAEMEAPEQISKLPFNSTGISVFLFVLLIISFNLFVFFMFISLHLITLVWSQLGRKRGPKTRRSSSNKHRMEAATGCELESERQRTSHVSHFHQLKLVTPVDSRYRDDKGHLDW